MHNIKIISTSNFYGTVANLIQIMKMADAFSGLRHNVEIFIPGWKRSINSMELSKKFGVKNDFKIHFIPKITIRGKFSIITFAIGSLLRSLFWNEKTIILTRTDRVAALLARAGKKVIYENHTFYFPSNTTTSKFRRRVKAVMRNRNVCMVAISQRLKELWINYRINSDKIYVAHDGVDLAEFKGMAKIEKKDIRKRLRLPGEKEIICYTGSLSPDRGIGFILDAAAYYKDKNFLFLIIGGSAPEIRRYKNKLQTDNVSFTGYIENSKIPLYLRSADLLVMPYQKTVVTIDGCSPMKAFEYLASGNYILAPIFPSFYEIMKDFEGITFYDADDRQKFIYEIGEILTNPDASRYYDRFDNLEKYSWQNRAKNLLNIYFQFFSPDMLPIVH